MLINLNRYRCISVNQKCATTFIFLLAMVVSFISQAAPAKASLETLIAEEKLQIKINAVGSESLIPNQPVAIEVEVLSAYPFSDNFTLSYVDLADTVVIQANDKTQLNAIEIEGQQWFTQRKVIIVYPLIAGVYNVPVITAKVFINVNYREKLSGEIQTNKLDFTVNEQPLLQNLENYIVSSKVKAKLRQTPKDKQAFSIGSAVTYSYDIKADNVHVIMLPKLVIPVIEGVKVYEKPLVEKDVFDRFEKINTAQSTKEITFIFQKEGSFIIPQQKVLWWDTTSNTLKEGIFKQQTITVSIESADGLSNSPSNDNRDSRAINLSKLSRDELINWLYTLAVVIFLIAILRQVIKHKNALVASYHQANKTKEKAIVKSFSSHVKTKEYQLAMACLYQLTRTSAASVSALSSLVGKDNLERLNRLQQLAFNPVHPDTSVNELTTERSVKFIQEDSVLLLNALLKKENNGTKPTRFQFSFKLNPDK